jgi:hypothetical protein
LSEYPKTPHDRFPGTALDQSIEGGEPMFASGKLVSAAWHSLGSDATLSRPRRRRYTPEVAPLEERTTLSTAAGIPAAIAPTVHATAAVHLAAVRSHGHHGTHVKFPGGSVVSNPGGPTMVNFPGGMVNSSPGSTVVTFPGGFVTSGTGGTVIRFPGGSIVIG